MGRHSATTRLHLAPACARHQGRLLPGEAAVWAAQGPWRGPGQTPFLSNPLVIRYLMKVFLETGRNHSFRPPAPHPQVQTCTHGPPGPAPTGSPAHTLRPAPSAPGRTSL